MIPVTKKGRNYLNQCRSDHQQRQEYVDASPVVPDRMDQPLVPPQSVHDPVVIFHHPPHQAFFVHDHHHNPAVDKAVAIYCPIVMMVRAMSSDTPHSMMVDLGTHLAPCGAFVRIECTRFWPRFACNVKTSSRGIATIVVRVEGGRRLVWDSWAELLPAVLWILLPDGTHSSCPPCNDIALFSSRWFGRCRDGLASHCCCCCCCCCCSCCCSTCHCGLFLMK